MEELTIEAWGAFWVWDNDRFLYRNTQTGEIVGTRKIIDLRDTFIERQKAWVDELVDSPFDGNLTIQEWESKFAKTIKDTYLIAYMLAIGGASDLTEVMKEEIGIILKDEYHSLDDFARDIAKGKYTGDSPNWVKQHVKLRARAYIDSVRQAIAWP